MQDDRREPPPPSARPRRSLRRRMAVRLIVAVTVVAFLSLSGCMERFFYYPTAEPTPPPRSHAGAEKVTFTSSDGTRLTGWFIPARGEQASTPGPGILHAHGNAGSMVSHLYFTEYLPHAGFHVFLFDYRGYGESEGAPRHRNDLIADCAAALDALLARPEVDPQRIGLYGQSLGGSIGINVAAERREIRAAALESPFTSWRDAAASALGGASPGLIARAVSSLFIHDHRRADEALRRFARPTLILHGTADSIVPITHGRRMREAAPEHTELVELPGGDHNSLRDSHPEVESLVIDFFRRELAPGPDL